MSHNLSDLRIVASILALVGCPAPEDKTADTTTGTPPTAAVCGDGVVAGDEACDDGNRDDTDACLSTCEAARCGDGVVGAGVEDCDDGNDDNTDACLSNCQSARCGDGVVWAGVEACDDGNGDDSDACLTTCEAASCGDGVVWAGFEACDDGNTTAHDGCSPTCERPRTVSLSNAYAEITAEQAGDGLGYTVAAGDLNGDGFQDVFVGAPQHDGGGASSGAAFVVYGPVVGAIDVTNAGARLIGVAASDAAGRSVAVGDLDGDGIDDLVVGADGADAGGSASGAAYVLYGPVTGESSLSDADARLLFAPGDDAGFYVAVGGDLDGLGLPDLLVSASGHARNGANAGAVYLFASPLVGDVDVADAHAVVLGEAANDYLGTMGGAADIDGDGQHDLVVATPLNDAGGTSAGATWVFAGPVGGTLVVADADVSLIGDPGDGSGVAVACGDVDGDGTDDLLIGADGNSLGAPDAGAAYLVPGQTSGILALSAAATSVMVGERADDYAGASVTIPGDVDGDGALDVVIGAAYTDSSAFHAGAAYLLYGPIAGRIDLANADVIYEGAADSDNAGSVVGRAGDVDGDGFDDLLIGATSAGRGGTVYVVRGVP